MKNITTSNKTNMAQIYHMDETGSTNEELKLFALKHNVTIPYALVAKRQFAGKGTRGRKWESSEGALLFSVVLPWDYVKLKTSLVPLVAGMSICDVLRSLGGAVSLKWPNDIWFQHGKAGGILCELSTDVANRKVIIIGVGINKYHSTKKTTNGWSITGIGNYLNCDVDFIVNKFICSLIELFQCDNDRIVRKWSEYDHFLGCELNFIVESNKESFIGVDLGVNDLGQLILQTKQGMMTFYSGTISYDDAIN